jgi:hypothetical protein
VAAGVDRPTFVTAADPEHRRAMVVEGARGEDRTRDLVYLAVRDIAPTPEQINSRTTYDEAAIDELAASIGEHGVLQPVLVRPIEPQDLQELRDGPRIVRFGEEWAPSYVLVAGNRRHMAAERAGREFIPAMIRVVERDQAFVLNIVENIQREELSGRERIRAIDLLASLRDARGQPYSTRALAELVKKDHARSRSGWGCTACRRWRTRSPTAPCASATPWCSSRRCATCRGRPCPRSCRSWCRRPPRSRSARSRTT